MCIYNLIYQQYDKINISFQCSLSQVIQFKKVKILAVIIFIASRLIFNAEFNLDSTYIFLLSTSAGMSASSDKQQLIQVHQQHQQSFFKGHAEDADLPPTELSGDENGQQSVFSEVDSPNKSNFLLTVTTIIKTIIGSGILGLPYTVSKCGWLFASIIFVAASVLTQYSSIILLNAKNLSGHSNYSTILYHAYQNKFCKSLGSIVIFLNNLGVCILEIIIFKDSITGIIKKVNPDIQDQWYTSRTFIALLIATLEIPNILVKKIERLKFMAFIGVTGILVFMGTVVIRYAFTASQAGPATRSMKTFPDDWFGAIASIPNLILALGFQMNFFPIYKGMRNASDKKYAQATLTGILVCSFSYLLIGILGYHLVYSLQGKDEVFANFLTNFDYDPNDQPFIYFVINIGFLLSVFFAFPIIFFGARNNFIALIQLFFSKDTPKSSRKWREDKDTVEQISSYIQSEEQQLRKKKTNRLFYIYTFALFTVVVVAGVLLNSIEAVFNIVGAVCSTSISALLPCLFYFILVIKKKKERNIKFYASVAIFAILTPFAVFSVVANYVR